MRICYHLYRGSGRIEDGEINRNAHTEKHRYTEQSSEQTHFRPLLKYVFKRNISKMDAKHATVHTFSRFLRSNKMS